MNLAELAGPQKLLCTPIDEKAFLCGLGSGMGVDEEQLGEGEPGSSSNFPSSSWSKIKHVTVGDTLRGKGRLHSAFHRYRILGFLCGFSF